MRRKIGQVVVSGLAALSLLGAAVPAAAQDSVPQGGVAEPSAESRALAARVIAVTTLNFEKQVLEAMRTMLADLNLRDADEKLGTWFEKNAGPILLTHLRTMMAEYEVIYARTFTVPELEAMVAFYDTPVGRSISEKQVTLALASTEVEGRIMQAYATDLMTQMCAANDCGDLKGGTPATRKPAGR